MKNNPFVLPGFGQTGEMAENPILASMEMMRKAWEGLATPGNMDAAAMGRLMSVEDMDKRISDLRAVENWLRLNLSMLQSTIQGLEVQRATVSTLKSFVETGFGSTPAGAQGAERPRGHSPVEEVLKTWSAQSHESKPQTPDAPPPSAAQADPAPAGQAEAKPPQDNEPAGLSGAPDGDESASAQQDVLGAAASAAQGWWGLVQQQFQNLAAATAASAEGAMAEMQEAAAQAAQTAERVSKTATAGAGRAAKKSSAAKSARKTSTASKTASAGKATKATKASAAGKAAKATKSSAVKKTASRTSTARKTSR